MSVFRCVATLALIGSASAVTCKDDPTGELAGNSMMPGLTCPVAMGLLGASCETDLNANPITSSMFPAKSFVWTLCPETCKKCPEWLAAFPNGINKLNVDSSAATTTAVTADRPTAKPTAAPYVCKDDPFGTLATNPIMPNLKCDFLMTLIGGKDCELDLKTKLATLKEGTIVWKVCPVTCGVCEKWVKEAPTMDLSVPAIVAPATAATAKPTAAATAKPTEAATAKPSTAATEAATAKPTAAATAKPTAAATAKPTAAATAKPTEAATTAGGVSKGDCPQNDGPKMFTFYNVKLGTRCLSTTRFPLKMFLAVCKPLTEAQKLVKVHILPADGKPGLAVQLERNSEQSGCLEGVAGSVAKWTDCAAKETTVLRILRPEGSTRPVRIVGPGNLCLTAGGTAANPDLQFNECNKNTKDKLQLFFMDVPIPA